MKKWWFVPVFALVLAGGYTFVNAEHAAGVHSIQITDLGITPPTITVTENETVKLTVTNSGTKKHNLVIPDYYIFTHNLSAGESTDAEFTANKKGNFPYYSDTPGQPEPGIKGMLIVK